MAEAIINKGVAGYESEVITDKISAIQLAFTDDEAMNNRIGIMISVDGEIYVKNYTFSTNDKNICLAVEDDVEGLSKKIWSKNMPSAINYL